MRIWRQITQVATVAVLVVCNASRIIFEIYRDPPDVLGNIVTGLTAKTNTIA